MRPSAASSAGAEKNARTTRNWRYVRTWTSDFNHVLYTYVRTLSVSKYILFIRKSHVANLNILVRKTSHYQIHILVSTTTQLPALTMHHHLRASPPLLFTSRLQISQELGGLASFSGICRRGQTHVK